MRLAKTQEKTDKEKQTKPDENKIRKAKDKLIASILFLILMLVALLLIKLPQANLCLSSSCASETGQITWRSLFDTAMEMGLVGIVTSPLLIVFIFIVTLLTHPLLAVLFLAITIFMIVLPIKVLAKAISNYKGAKNGLRNSNS